MVFSDFEEIVIGGLGWRYNVSFWLDGVLVVFEVMFMEVMLGLDYSIFESMGMGGWGIVLLEEDEVVKGDREYWVDYVGELLFVVVVGRKLGG